MWAFRLRSTSFDSFKTFKTGDDNGQCDPNRSTHELHRDCSGLVIGLGGAGAAIGFGLLGGKFLESSARRRSSPTCCNEDVHRCRFARCGAHHRRRRRLLAAVRQSFPRRLRPEVAALMRTRTGRGSVPELSTYAGNCEVVVFFLVASAVMKFFWLAGHGAIRSTAEGSRRGSGRGRQREDLSEAEARSKDHPRGARDRADTRSGRRAPTIGR